MEQLLKDEVYEKKKCAWFFSKKDQNFDLSNMASGMTIKYGGIVWHSSEQLYQASKYAGDVMCLPSSGGSQPNVRQRIIESTNAMGAKMTQKCAAKAKLVRHDWEEVLIENMLFVLKLKLKNNCVKFRKVLRDTGNRDIVEISEKDDFWGTKEIGHGILKGKNVLGKLLVIVRDNIDTILTEKLVEPHNFMLP